jgi:hypothetical protein
MTRRSGPYEEVFAVAPTTGDWQETLAFVPQGQAVMLDATFDAVPGVVEIEAQRWVPSAAVWGACGTTVWQFVVNAAGTATLPLAGLTFLENERYRFRFRTENPNVNASIRALAHDGDPSAGATATTGAGGGLGLWDVLLTSASEAAGAYPHTDYYPAAAGQVFGTAEDLQLEVLATGTATPSTARWRVEFQLTPGGDWHDVSLSGTDVRLGTPGFASCESVDAVATRRLWHFDNAETYAWRLALDLLLAASGPVYAAWRKR